MELLSILRWILVAPPGALWLIILICNLYEPAKYLARGLRPPPPDYRHCSPIPVAGTLAGLLVLQIAPLTELATVTRIVFISAAVLPDLVLIPQLLFAVLVLGAFRR